MQIEAKPEFARALAAAIVADIEGNPDLKLAILERRLDGPGFARWLDRQLRSHAGRSRVPSVWALVHDAEREIAQVRAGLGQFDFGELIGDLIKTGATVATTIYTAEAKADTDRAIAQIKAQQQTALAQTQLATDTLQAQLARQQYVSAEAEPGIGGIPWWGVALGLAAVGTGVYLISRRR